VQAILDDQPARGNPFQNYPVDDVGRFFEGASRELGSLADQLPDLFSDFVASQLRRPSEWPRMRPTMIGGGTLAGHLLALARDIDQMFYPSEQRARCPGPFVNPRRVFMSHGRAHERRELQATLNVTSACLFLSWHRNRIKG
jgi:hypothetical protein